MLLVTAAAAACQRQLEWHPQRTCVSVQVAMCLESTSPSCPVCVSACAPTANRRADLPNRRADLPSRRSSSTNPRSLRRHCVEARSISSGMRLQPRRSCAVNASDLKLGLFTLELSARACRFRLPTRTQCCELYATRWQGTCASVERVPPCESPPEAT